MNGAKNLHNLVTRHRWRGHDKHAPRLYHWSTKRVAAGWAEQGICWRFVSAFRTVNFNHSTSPNRFKPMVIYALCKPSFESFILLVFRRKSYSSTRQRVLRGENSATIVFEATGCSRQA